MLINVKMTTFVGILTFISMINAISENLVYFFAYWVILHAFCRLLIFLSQLFHNTITVSNCYNLDMEMSIFAAYNFNYANLGNFWNKLN